MSKLIVVFMVGMALMLGCVGQAEEEVCAPCPEYPVHLLESLRTCEDEGALLRQGMDATEGYLQQQLDEMTIEAIEANERYNEINKEHNTLKEQYVFLKQENEWLHQSNKILTEKGIHNIEYVPQKWLNNVEISGDRVDLNNGDFVLMIDGGTSSMAPLFGRCYNCATFIIKRDVEVSDIEIGDIVVFRMDNEDYIHRVTSKTNGKLLTQGDATFGTDLKYVTNNNLRGVLVGIIYGGMR